VIQRRRSPLDKRAVDPRVLLISPAFPPASGGIERTAAEVAFGLGDCSVEVVSGRPTSSVGIGPPAGIHVHWAANDPPYGRRATFSLIRLAVRVGLEFRPDLVLALHIRAMPAAQTLRRLLGARSILVVHANELTEQASLAGAAVTWADAIVAVSEFSRRVAIGTGADSDRIRIIHPGVKLPLAAPPALAARRGVPRIITVARMTERYKGHDIALAALQRLVTRIPEVHWTMVGDGPLREALRRTASERGLDGRVEFPGAIGDRELEWRLRAAHVFCLPSRVPTNGTAGEGFGIALVEAGAHGLPVIAGRVPGVIDAVQDGVTGILVDPRDPEAIATALERVLSDGALAERLAHRGYERAQALAWPAVAQRYRALIEEVLMAPGGRRARPGPAWLGDLVVGPRTRDRPAGSSR
jgi:phosphatidyl-myo-inositol dimannoside synthase